MNRDKDTYRMQFDVLQFERQLNSLQYRKMV